MVIATLGPDGASPPTRASLPTAGARVDARDTIGAGDAFAGALVAALDRGAAVGDALAYATAAGSLACTRAGAQAALPSRHEASLAAAQLQSTLARTPL